MDVPLSPELYAKLARLAQKRGTDAQALAREAIGRLLDYDDWFVREVEKGLGQVDSGNTLRHEEVATRLNNHLTGQTAAPLMQPRWTEEAANDLERSSHFQIAAT